MGWGKEIGEAIRLQCGEGLRWRRGRRGGEEKVVCCWGFILRKRNLEVREVKKVITWDTSASRFFFFSFERLKSITLKKGEQFFFVLICSWLGVCELINPKICFDLFVLFLFSVPVMPQ